MLTLSLAGITVDLPDSWTGTTKVERSGMPVIHAGNFDVPGSDDTPGNRAQEKLRNRDVLITLWEYARDGQQGTDAFPPLDEPLEIAPAHFGTFEGVEASAYALRTFSVNNRLLQLGVAFGDPAPRWRTIAEVNGILETVVVS